jgi:hypothetical protein
MAGLDNMAPAAVLRFLVDSSQGLLPMVNPLVDEMTPWKVYSLGRSITLDWLVTSIREASSNELKTTARVFPSRI